MTWIGFWGFFLLASLSVYAVTVVVVGIGAFFDVRRLFATAAENAAAARARADDAER